MTFTIVGTGHRPQDIPDLGRKFSPEQYSALLEIARRATRKVMACYRLREVTVVAGGALGWDMALAEAALSIPGVTLHVMLPARQAQCITRWGHMPETVARWHGINARAARLTELPQQGRSYGQQLNWRNEQMLEQIQNAGCVLAYWSGKPHGGTFNTITFARRRGLTCHNAYGL